MDIKVETIYSVNLNQREAEMLCSILAHVKINMLNDEAKRMIKEIHNSLDR